MNTELPTLLSKATFTEPSCVGELGSYTGGSARSIATYLEKNNIQAKFFAIDWFNGSPFKEGEGPVVPAIDPEEFRRNLSGHACELIVKESGEAAELFDDEVFDFFFIDADHRYHMIKRDIELWYPKVKVGGILSGHDYEQEEYNEDLIEQDTDRMVCIHHGVIKAVNERFGIPNYENRCWWVRKE